MSKKTFWLIVGAAIIVALVWVGVKHMRTTATVVESDAVVEEIVDQPADMAEVPAPSVEM